MGFWGTLFSDKPILKREATYAKASPVGFPGEFGVLPMTISAFWEDPMMWKFQAKNHHGVSNDCGAVEY